MCIRDSSDTDTDQNTVIFKLKYTRRPVIRYSVVRKFPFKSSSFFCTIKKLIFCRYVDNNFYIQQNFRHRMLVHGNGPF